MDSGEGAECKGTACGLNAKTAAKAQSARALARASLLKAPGAWAPEMDSGEGAECKGSVLQSKDSGEGAQRKGTGNSPLL